jgi:hypothetical protein
MSHPGPSELDSCLDFVELEDSFSLCNFVVDDPQRPAQHDSLRVSLLFLAETTGDRV